jgi:hypothetical protein
LEDSAFCRRTPWALLVALSGESEKGARYGPSLFCGHGWRARRGAEKFRGSFFSGRWAKNTLWSLSWRAAEFLQAASVLVPGGGVEDTDGRQIIRFEAGNHLGPKHDLFRIPANRLRDFP